MKFCSRCKFDKDEDQFGKNRSEPDGLQEYCKVCRKTLNHDQYYKHRDESHTIKNSKKSPGYLGIHIAERVLASVYKNVKTMPFGNPGYDFICGRGYKIDVKSSVLLQYTVYDNRNGVRYGPYLNNPIWHFAIRANKSADYFLLLGFDSREALNPLHLWLIDGELINKKKTLVIQNTEKGLSKYFKFERPIDATVQCCNLLKEEAKT